MVDFVRLALLFTFRFTSALMVTRHQYQTVELQFYSYHKVRY